MKTDIMYGRLIAANDATVTLEVIIDPENETFEERVFPKFLFQGLGGLTFGTFYRLVVTQEPRKMTHEFFRADAEATFLNTYYDLIQDTAAQEYADITERLGKANN